MNYSLILIDMQKYFAAANNRRVQLGCRQAIYQAIADNAPIILVEYKGYGGTIRSLTDVISRLKYRRKFVVRKYDNDGADEIFDAIEKNKLPCKKLRLGGINTDCCVLETVFGLVNRYKLKNNIEVIANACGSEHSHADGLYELRQSGVKIIK
jgi:nicotinamidase-related amidase